jgi:acyl carrier protein
MATTTGANDEATIEAIRTAAAGALEDRRLDGVAADTSLVRSGIVSSLEIVVLAAALEERFELHIPAAQVTLQNFDTLRGMAVLVQTGGGHSASLDDPATRAEGGFLRASAAAAIRRPVLLVALTLCFLTLLDAGLGAVMRGPMAERHHAFLEDGQRLYPVGGSYSQDDLAFSVEAGSLTSRCRGARVSRCSAIRGRSGRSSPLTMRYQGR